MSTNRRRFLEQAAANAAAMAIAPAVAFARPLNNDSSVGPHDSDQWDLSWTDHLKGNHCAVFDTTEPESGDGAWRAQLWKSQVIEVLKVAPGNVIPVIVLRHNAVVLAMQQSFWDKYAIGKKKKVMNPMNNEPTDRNPLLFNEKDGLPPSMAAGLLPAQIAAGAIVLACNLALNQCAGLIAESDKVSSEEAHKRAVAYLIPGVILQPSGVFAVIRAQEAGASYIMAN